MIINEKGKEMRVKLCELVNIDIVNTTIAYNWR